jgi:branched-chain amino acid transport system substrate-binding protein
MGYGRADASDGRIFPWIFPLGTNYWSQNTAKIKYIADKEGGFDKLKGKKIANLYHESSYGSETIPILNKQAEMYGFIVKHYPVPHPGLDQKATWLQIVRQFKPDWIILRGWGAMNPTALKEAAREGYSTKKILGVWWSGAEEDVIPAGDAAKGYVAAGFHPSGKDFPLIKAIVDTVHGGGKGNIDPKRIGTIYYNRGIVSGIVVSEALRIAQEKYGKGKVMNGEQIRWGIENLNITLERIKEIGAEGLMSPIKVSCYDHEGQGMVKFQEWDGQKWKVVTDWIKPDFKLVRPFLEESAAKYAKENNITKRTGMSMDSNCSQ